MKLKHKLLLTAAGLGLLAASPSYGPGGYWEGLTMVNGIIGITNAISVIPSGSTVSAYLQVILGRQFNVDDFGAAGQGALGVDDGPKINAALAACSLRGGGVVKLSAKQYAFTSVDIVVPQTCSLEGEVSPGFQIIPGGPNWDTTPYTLVASNGHGVKLSAASGLKKATLRTSFITTTPQTVRGAIQMQTSMAGAGAGITFLGNGDQKIDDVVVVGFNQCFTGLSSGRIVGNHLRGDCINGLSVDNSHDWSTFSDVEFWPTLTVGAQLPFELFTVTGATNVSGQIQLNLSTTQSALPGYSSLVTGDKLSVWSLGGLAGAYHTYTITVVSQTASTAVVKLNGSVYSGAYTSGGQAGINLIERFGTAYSVTNGEATTCDVCNSFGWQIGVSFGVGSLGSQWRASSVDADFTTQDGDSVGVVMTGAGNYENIFDGGYIADRATALNLVSSVAAARPNRVMNTDLVFYPLNLSSGVIIGGFGDYILSNNAGGLNPTTMVVTGTPASVVLTGNYMPSTAVQYLNTALQALTIGVGNTFAQTANPCCTISTSSIAVPSTYSCIPGQIIADPAGFIQVCTAANTWKRAALSAY